MPFQLTEARIAANRLNAQRSTGPRTEAGKIRSRANAVKHGLTGAGVALPVEDEQLVEQRFLAIQEELAPQTVLGSFFAHQVALMTVRCQRAARQESKAIASRVRRAPAEWDEARSAEADHLLGWIGAEPISYHRKLMATPEGVDRLIKTLLGLRQELNRSVVVWDCNHAQQLAACFGTRESDVPYSRNRRLSDAIGGNFAGIEPSEIAHIESKDAQRNWACDRMDEHIRAEVARLEEHRASLDLAGLELDRAEAAERALFDPGKEAILARKYEAAATRELYRALREFREVEATGDLEGSEVITQAEATDQTFLDGDRVVLEAGETEDFIDRKPHPKNDLERSLGSIGKVWVRAGKASSAGACLIPAKPDQPLDRVHRGRRKRLA